MVGIDASGSVALVTDKKSFRVAFNFRIYKPVNQYAFIVPPEMSIAVRIFPAYP